MNLYHHFSIDLLHIDKFFVIWFAHQHLRKNVRFLVAAVPHITLQFPHPLDALIRIHEDLEIRETTKRFIIERVETFDDDYWSRLEFDWRTEGAMRMIIDRLHDRFTRFQPTHVGCETRKIVGARIQGSDPLLFALFTV